MSLLSYKLNVTIILHEAQVELRLFCRKRLIVQTSSIQHRYQNALQMFASLLVWGKYLTKCEGNNILLKAM